jgi:hypothetical protein
MKDFNDKRIGVRLRAVDAANVKTLLTVAGPFSDLAGISDVVRLALKVAADSIRQAQAR